MGCMGCDSRVLGWRGLRALGRNTPKDTPAVNSLEDAIYPSISFMADENAVLEEAMDNLKEAGQHLRATQSLMRSQGMTDGENYRDLLTRLSTALAMAKRHTSRPGVGGISS
jgi:hypothetical protein